MVAVTSNHPAPVAAELEQWLVSKLAQLCEVAPGEIDRRKPLQSYGLDSLAAFTIAGQLVDWLQEDLPVHLLWEYRTVASLARYLAGHLRHRQTSSPLATLQPQGEKPPLFLVPPGGTSVLTFSNLVQHLGREFPVYGFEHRGLQDVDLAHTTTEEMASCYVEQMQAVQPIGPYYIGGCCSGGLVALEMAQQLVELGQRVALLFVIEAHAPPAKFWKGIAAGGLELHSVPGDHRSLTREPNVQVLARQLRELLDAGQDASQTTAAETQDAETAVQAAMRHHPSVTTTGIEKDVP